MEPVSARSAFRMASRHRILDARAGIAAEIARLDRKGAARAFNHRRAAEQLPHTPAVERRRHDRMRNSSRNPRWHSSASANPRSASSERSWNSSNSTAPIPASPGSSRIMRVNTPSVTTSMRVLAPTCRESPRTDALADRLRHGAPCAGPHRGQRGGAAREPGFLPTLQPGLVQQRERHPRRLAGTRRRHQHGRTRSQVASRSSRTASMGSGAANCIAAVSGGHVPSASTMCGGRRRPTKCRRFHPSPFHELPR